jgi:hypothetical protein
LLEGLLVLGDQALASSKMYLKLTPSGLTGNATANAQLNADIQKQNKIIEDGHTTIAKKAEQTV